MMTETANIALRAGLPEQDRAAPVARTIPETCTHYGWTRSFVYVQLGAGRLQAVKAGRRTLVTTASADALFATLPRASFGKSHSLAA